MPHPVNDAAFRLGVLSHSFHLHSVGAPTVPLHSLSRAANPAHRGRFTIDLPDSPAVRQEVTAMLLSDTARLPVARTRWLRLWLHARAVWLEAALRP